MPYLIGLIGRMSGQVLTQLKRNNIFQVFQMKEKFGNILDLLKIIRLWLLSLAYVNRSKVSFF